MTIDSNNPKHIIADEGKKIVRKSDGLNYGKEVYLGYTYYIGGQKLNEPHLEVVDDMIEVDLTPEELEAEANMKEEIENHE